MTSNLGRRVLQARQEAGLTQKQLAEGINKTTQSVKLVEKGLSSMKLETFITLCEFTNKTPNFFMQDDCRQAKIENIVSMIDKVDSFNGSQLDLLKEALEKIINHKNNININDCQ
jgi:transcriptional regulator with XRE-family HTH domain